MSTPGAEDSLQNPQPELAAFRQKRAASTSPEQDTQKKPCFQESPERSQNFNSNLNFEEIEEEGNMEKVLSEMQEIRAAISRQEESIVTRLRQELLGMKEEINSLKQEVQQKDETIKKLERRIEEVEKRRDDNENHNRLNNIRINGIPETKDESCEDIVIKVAGALGVEIDPNDIDRAHRTGKPKKDEPKAIICRFNKFKARKQITMNKKKLKDDEEVMKTLVTVLDNDLKIKLGDEAKIFINDDLTKSKSALAAEVRKKKKADVIKGTWVSYGKIFAQKHDDSVVVIKSYSDILGL